MPELRPASTHPIQQNTKPIGVLLVGHGTRDEVGTQQFFELSEKLQHHLPSMQVQPCLLEFQQPTIPEAWNRLVSQGVSEIRVAPLLLFAAGHAKQDIPDLVQKCQAETPHVSFTHTRPISRQAALVELVCNHLQAAHKGFARPEDEITLMMVGRGSHDPCAQADMRVLSEVVSYRLGITNPSTSFYAMAKPRFAETLEQQARHSRSRKILIHPHLLFDGRLFQAIQQIVTQAQAKFPDVEIRLSSYLGPHELVAQSIAARITENTRQN
ncbi:sirohydrochlorin cobaltochelatase [Rhodopirellula maiorica SM1]|uniref:Sirohydrochlorin cobaltochelatase n=1 Tax=Rhodopirellula maiorica SM1 TaxID=1265738 RepID=M5RWE8_9BACT|nr:sirohydrochlorin chelatase [Rhodopirellula maiorica]EMI19722.1 sirohydrochlorin cobaltochelatase [Rhodopirellula maiorica SM1]